MDDPVMLGLVAVFLVAIGGIVIAKGATEISQC